MSDETSAIISSDGHIYDASIFANGIMFTAIKPQVSLIITDESMTDELDKVNKIIDEMHDDFYRKVDEVVTMLLGF
jgi:hypothetical protein